MVFILNQRLVVFNNNIYYLWFIERLDPNLYKPQFNVWLCTVYTCVYVCVWHSIIRNMKPATKTCRAFFLCLSPLIMSESPSN